MKHKLIETLETFAPGEWTDFGKYLRYRTNNKSDIADLFQFILKRKNRLHVTSDLEKVRLQSFKHLSPKGIVNLYSRLNLLLEDWLVIKEVEQNNYEKELLLVNAFNNRGLYDHADQEARKLEKQLSAIQPPPGKKNEVMHRLSHYQYYSNNPIKQREGPQLLEQLVEYAQSAHLEQSLLYQAELDRVQTRYRLDFTKTIDKIDQLKTTYDPTHYSEIHQLLVEMVQSEEVAPLKALWNKLAAGEVDTAYQGHTILALIVLTKCLKLWSKGVLRDAQLIADMYQYAMETGALLQNGKIPVIRFYNVLSSLGLSQTYEQVQTFINTWISKVESEDLNSIRAIANAQNALNHEKYDLILEHLRSIDCQGYENKGRVHCLEMIAYYEEDYDYDYVLNFIHNFRRTLRRNKSKIGNHAYQYFYNFSGIIEDLYKVKYEGKSMDLSDYDYIMYRSWVGKKVSG